MYSQFKSYSNFNGSDNFTHIDIKDGIIKKNVNGNVTIKKVDMSKIPITNNNYMSPFLNKNDLSLFQLPILPISLLENFHESSGYNLFTTSLSEFLLIFLFTIIMIFLIVNYNKYQK